MIILWPYNKFLHAYMKTIIFVKMGVLIILHFQHPPNLPKACFGASRHVFSYTCKNHNFYRDKYFGNFVNLTPSRPT